MRFLSAASLFVAAQAVIFAVAAPAPRAANVGEATHFTPGLGACGIASSEGQLVAAVSHLFYDTFPGATPNPNLNPVCGRQLTATYQGRSVTVTVVDKCPGCAGVYDLDLSLTAFSQLADPAVGRIAGVEWNLL